MIDDGLSPTDRRALASVALQFFVNGVIFASFIPRLPEVRDRIDVTTGTLGLLLAAGALSGLFGSVVVGRAIERLGTRRVLIAAGVAMCVSLPVVGLATMPIVFVVGLAALNTFDVLVDSAMNMQGSWISGRRRAPVMNRLHGLWSLGTVIGGVGASQLAGAGVSLRIHLLVVAVVLLVVVAFVGSGLLRDDEPVADAAPIVVAGNASHGGSDASEAPGRVKGRRPMVFLAIAGAASIAMELTSSDWAAFRLNDDFDAGARAAGLAYVAFTLGMTVGRFGGDSAILRFGQRRVADIGIVLTLVALAVASFAPVEWMVMIGYLGAGLGVATQFPKLYDDAAKLPGRPGAGLGALTGGSRVAMLVTPVVVGSLAATTLSVGAATAAVTLPGALVFGLVARRDRSTIS